MLKNTRHIFIIACVLGILAWGLSGGISFSHEKIQPQAIWNAVHSSNSNSNSNQNSNDNSVVDTDKDGLSDQDEAKYKTDPKNPDSDGDGFMDGSEVKDGYDPLKAAPNDRQVTDNSNQNAAVVTQTNSNTNKSLNNKNSGNSNITNIVSDKIDEIIAQYQLYSDSMSTLDGGKQKEIQDEIKNFTADLLKKTGLDFNFAIQDSDIKIDSTLDPDVNLYIANVKEILRKNQIITENQKLEDGFNNTITQLGEMRNSDINWEKVSNWETQNKNALNEIVQMPINPQLKDIHINLIKILKSFDIVFSNIQEGDYFRSFLSAGRASNINNQIKAFTDSVDKFTKK